MSHPDPSPHDDPTDPQLPALVEDTRTYFLVQPTEDTLGPRTVARHNRRLHSLGLLTDERGILDKLRGRTPTATVEVLLISEAGSGATITYAFGVDDPHAADTLQRTLRGSFPDTYELERVEWNADRVGTLLGATSTESEPHVAAVEYYGHAERRRDWMTSLAPFREFLTEEHARIPLASVVETMAETEASMVYQALVRPKTDWTATARDRRIALEASQDTIGDQVWNVIGEPMDYEEYTPPAEDQDRIEEIDTRDTRCSFEVNARVAVIEPPRTDPLLSLRDGDDPVDDTGPPDADGTPRADEAGQRPTPPALPAAGSTNPYAPAVGPGELEEIARELASAFRDVDGTFHRVDGTVSTGSDGRAVFDAIQNRTFHPPNYQRLRTWLPFTANTSRGIVVDSSEVANFWLLGGDALTAAGARAVAPTPGERTAIPRPPFDLLTNYRGDGLLVGAPLTQDGTLDDDPLVLPPSLQPLHVGWFGKTGSGKSTSLINAVLSTHAATDGADILIDPKGDGMATDYLRAHYAEYGTLENVLYFDCSEVLPAFSFFNIRDELAAGVERPTAVEDTVDHYVEILTQIMGRERFEQAVRSPDVIRYLVKAMFDPVNGYDAFSHRDLHAALRKMHERQSAPAVSDAELQRMLGGVVANQTRSFDEIMQGVANRIEKIPVDRRLARIFNHVPETPDAPRFDLAEYVNEDVVIVFDTGGLRSEAQRVLTLVVLSNLWTALRRRAKTSTAESDPLVNLYLEEAASVAVSDLLKDLLAQSRGFDCSVTLAMQFPGQVREHDATAYDEVLNNISTFVTGNVPVDRRLAQRLATDDMDAQAVGNRLRALRRGQWLVSLPAAFDESEPRPFLVGSAAPPPGDPAGRRPLSRAAKRAFERRRDDVRERTLAEAGLTLAEPGTVTHDDADAADDHDDPSADEATADDDADVRVDSALPHTKRMPTTVTYDESVSALRCTECGNRYDPNSTGIRRAIACCASIATINRDDVPICDLNLKLTPEERAASEWTDTQLMFLQAVYNAQQLRYDPLEYDLLNDSMIRLQEYVGIESTAVQDLIDADLLSHDTDHPHRLYTVTPDGRKAIGESYREGVDYGHGAGDLEESSQHVFAVEVGRRYLEQNYADDPDSPVTDVVPYFDIDQGRRLDVAGVDDDGDIHVAVEAERINHDRLHAIPEDFDKIVDSDVDHAVWIVMSRSGGHTVLETLNDPPDGEPRVEKTYAPSTPPQQFRIDTPGLTEIYTLEYARDNLLDTN